MAGLFFIGFLVILVQLLLPLAPTFLNFVLASEAKGQALRAALYWAGIELGVPLAGGLAGAFVAEFIQKRRSRSDARSRGNDSEG